MSIFTQLLASGRILFVDGATGSMLQKLGMPAGVNPAKFCLERKDIVREMHRAYFMAGADIILTPTFGGTKFKLPPSLDVEFFNREMARNALEITAELAGENAARPLFVAGDIGPSGHFSQPLGDVPPQDQIEAYRAQVRGLLAGGVDLFFIETQMDLAEVRAAVTAVKLECDLPIFVSMTFEDGVSLTGTSPEVFAATMCNMGVSALGVNCGVGPEEMLGVVKRLIASCDVPIFAEPNAGLPELIGSETVFRLDAASFAEKTAEFVACGAQIVGGCCGTEPQHIAALRQAVLARFPDGKVPPVCRRAPKGVCLTSRSQLVRFGEDEPVLLIGERINPTGKKKLSAEFQAGDFSLAMTYAEEQIAAKTRVLDVNTGAAGVDEEALLPALVGKLVARHQTPLCLDSSNPAALLAALPWHPGSALLNSISGEPGRMELLAPLCRVTGTPFILLPLQGRELPTNAVERISSIERLLTLAGQYGIPRHLVVVDVLAMTAASDQAAPVACLETIRWCRNNGLTTTIGLSNISFGLPARDLVNSGFLQMAAGAGLSSLIGNPGNIRLREALDTANLLLGRDGQARCFIERYGEWIAGDAAPELGKAEKVKPGKTLEGAILQGDKDVIPALLEEAMARGDDPFALVQERLIPALNEVGARFERKEYFLPQLLSSAEAMQAAFRLLSPLLEKSGQLEEKYPVILATVEGDIHDIGKNIVGLMLRNHGFEVIDLGKDVKAERIIAVAEERGVKVIGLSALMTTTMVRMEDTIRLVQQKGLPCKVMIGGAVVTADYARQIGADAYCRDAVESVRVARDWFGV